MNIQTGRKTFKKRQRETETESKRDRWLHSSSSKTNKSNEIFRLLFYPLFFHSQICRERKKNKKKKRKRKVMKMEE